MLLKKIFSVRFTSSFISALTFDTKATVYKFFKNLGAKKGDMKQVPNRVTTVLGATV
jgi:hypothetical protein